MPAEREGEPGRRWPRGRPPGPSSIPKCSAATTRTITATARRPAITLADGAKDHPILRGVEVDKLVGNGSLYKVSPLADIDDAAAHRQRSPTRSPSRSPGPTSPARRRPASSTRRSATSTTSQNPAFRKLLVNGLFWALEEPYPMGQDIDKLLPAAVK